jgi:uroporphyrinogen decarboxylase
MPAPETLGAEFDIEATAEAYARPLLERRTLSRDRTLFLGRYGIPGFMGGYTTWGYENYMSALALYPEHLRRYYALRAEQARLRNVAIVDAVRRYDLAPFAYTGDDICFNDGPICHPDVLDDLYFPALRHAIQPLIEADVRMIWHCDGDIRPILPQLLDAGISGFQGFQEEAGVMLEEMVGLRTRWGRKPILWGSVSVTTTLPFGTIADVKRRVEHCFRVAGPDGGFGLASTSSILPEAPLDNIITLFEYGRTFGRQFYTG